MMVWCVCAVMARAEDAPGVQGVRYSVTPETVRVVVDLAAAPVYVDQSTPAAPTVALDVPLASALTPVEVGDVIVQRVSIAPDAQGKACVTLALAKPRQVRIFTLSPLAGKPYRLVIDVAKRFTREETRALSPGVTYTNIEQQTDDRYVQAHVIAANLRDPQVRLAVTAAQGERERVASMVTRTGAVCGVNGGYFLDGTRPVGLLKIDGAVLSLPLWGRTAAAFPLQGAPILGNPRGTWRLTLADGSTQDVPDGLDASTQTPLPKTLLYAGQNFLKIGPNAAGANMVVQDGKVIHVTHDAVTLVPGQFALVVRDFVQAPYAAQLAVDSPLTVAPVTDPAWGEYPCAVGGGPRLLRGGAVAITGKDERFKPDILQGRAARTGLGLTADGQVLLAVVEAPGPYGGGATLEELAQLLQARGAVDAMNLDGGGSTNLAIGAASVNYPPNAWVRPVATGVMVYDSRMSPVPPDTGTAP